MKNFMTSVKVAARPKNVFDLSHDVKLSMKFGKLYPSLVMDVLPGEKFQLSCDHLVRFAPLVFPTMHRFTVRTDYFFVPNRILWPNWENFITNKVAPPGTQPVHPYYIVQPDGSNYGDLIDNLGMPRPPVGAPNTERMNALPIWAYHKIWNDYYRQDFIIPEFSTVMVDGDNTALITSNSLQNLRRRAWKHDYFTSMLPTPQHGAPVEIPINLADGHVYVERAVIGTGDEFINTSHADDAVIYQSESDVAGINAGDMFIKGEELDNSTTIEDFRRASAIQRFFERIMRAGRRYKEILMSAFGEDGDDGRLQRPELIFSTESPVVVSEVLNTSDTENAPQGNLAGHGIGVNRGRYGSYKAKEHGWILGIMSVIPESAYQNGVNRMLMHKDSYLDYPWPEFYNLGEEAIQLRELFGYTINQDTTLGYLPRYSRYRTMDSRVCGQMRTTMANFHFGRVFDMAGVPALNQAFIECNPGKRIFAVTDEDVDELQAHVLHRIIGVRAIPKYGTPSLS